MKERSNSMYAKKTPEKWMEELLAGRYDNETSAKKAVSKTSWDNDVKERAKELAVKHFAMPGSVKAGDLFASVGGSAHSTVANNRKTNGKHKVESAPLASTAQPEPPSANATANRIAVVNSYIYGCRAALDALRLASQLYHGIDVSDGEMLVGKLLNSLIPELLELAGGMFGHKTNGKAGAKPTTLPIVPNYTPEQQELFEATRPRV
jgi:hypothetical protein